VNAKTQRARVELFLAVPDFKFHYFVPHPAYELIDATPFQGFDQGLVDTVDLLRFVPMCPTDVRELISDWIHVAQFRAFGKLSYNLLPIQIPFLEEGLRFVNAVLTCVLSNGITYVDAKRAAKRHVWPVLHLTTEDGQDSTKFADVNDNTFREYVLRVAEHILKTGDKSKEHMVPALKEIASQHYECRRNKTNLTTFNHNVTAPNEMALESIRQLVTETQALPNPRSQEGYVEAICKSADFLTRARRKALNELKGDPETILSAVLATPGYYHRNVFAARTGLDKDAQIVARVSRFVREHEGYSMKWSGQDHNLVLSPFGHGVMEIRAKEMKVFTAGLSIRAASQLAPVFRLPQLPANISWQLNRIVGCAGGVSPNRLQKLNKIVYELKTELRKFVPHEIMDRLALLQGELKIVSDWPLEWLDVDGIPCQFRFNTSRIPATPGNMLFSGLIETRERLVSRSAFDEILIIRSFSDADPLRNILERAIKMAPMTDSRSSRIRFADVKSVAELIDTLNSYNGALVIFDCHGAYNTEDLIGTLVIGEARVDPWELKGKVRIPPIVLLSACDTHSLNGSHASVANGMLVLGAITVLGTLLPVNAFASAVLISRLLLRVQEFIPIHTERFNHSLRWSEVISGMQRMSYVTDILHLLPRIGIKLDRESFEYIQLRTNNRINPYDKYWYVEFWRVLAERVGLRSADVILFAQKWCQFTESMKYIQMGNPESILIMSESVERETRPEENVLSN